MAQPAHPARRVALALLAWSTVVIGGGVATLVSGTAGEASAEVRTSPPAERAAAHVERATGAGAPGSSTSVTTTAVPVTETTAAPVDAATTTVADAEEAGAPPEEMTTTAPPPVDTVPPPLAPAPGRYPVALHGSSTLNGKPQALPATGQLVVQDLGDGTQRHTVPGGVGSLDLVLRHTDAGAELVALDFAAGGLAFSFRPAPGSLLYAFDAPDGQAWSWQVTSTNGKATIAHRATVVAHDTLTVAGAQVPVTVVDAVLTVSGGVAGTIGLRSSLAIDRRVLVAQRQVVDVVAKVGGFAVPFVADTALTLTGLIPA